MFSADIFNPNIVNDKGKMDTAGVGLPESMCVTDGAVAVFGEVLLKKLLGDDAGLGKAVHTFSYFHVDPAFFINNIAKVVSEDDFFG